MSKAKHVLTTSAKPTPTGRSTLSTGRAVSSHNVSETGALPVLPKGIPPSHDLLEFQLAPSVLYEVVSARVHLKDHTPECDAAEVRVDAGYERLERVRDRIWKKPVRSWSDLRDLAEVAYNWADKKGNDDPAERSPMAYFTCEHASLFEVASAHLVRAIPTLGGVHA